MLVGDDHNVAILVSADGDLLPAVELAAEVAGESAIEVASWSGPSWSPSALSVSGRKVRQHKLTQQLYDRIADPTNYGDRTVKPPVGAAGSVPPGPHQHARDSRSPSARAG